MSVEITQWFDGRLRPVGHWLDRGSNRAKLLMVPLIVFELLFFIVPLFYLLRISLFASAESAAYQPGTVTLGSYVQLLNSELVHGLVVFTMQFTIIVTVVTVCLATILSYAIWRADGIRKTVLLFAVILPLLTTLVVKLYSVLLILSPIGPLNTMLMGAGVIDVPALLINNLTGVVIGQVYTALPYATLAIYSVMATIDWKTVEAAQDLGASRPRSFFEVVLPQSLPGITVGTIITFAWSVGAYASPALLGSASEKTFALEVERLMLREFDWPAASALSILLLLFVLASIIIMFNLLERWGGEQFDV